jgi:hypothetical protein
MNEFTRWIFVARKCVITTILAPICAFVFSAPVLAGSTFGGVITSITTNSDLGIISIVSNGTNNGTPACSTTPGGWALALTPANNQVYAQLLMAFSTQSTVYIWGDGVCTVNSGIETLVQLQVGGTTP